MNARNDIHRPSAIVPAEYEMVAYDYIGPNAPFLDGTFLKSERNLFRDHQAKTGGKYANHCHGGTCHICGATAFYVARFHHAKTNTYITVGEDCAEKLAMGSPSAFRMFRDAIKNASKAAKGKRLAKQILIDLGLERVWNIYYIDKPGHGYEKYEENTICDITSKLVKYGSVSDAQIKYLRTLLEKIDNRAVIEAKRAEEYAKAAPVPTTEGRVEIEGKVLTIKDPDEWAAFPQRKILVETKDGWKVWGSLPSNLSDLTKGEKIKFFASLKPSDRDPKFGFFSRPTKAKVVREEVVENVE